jgi:hypothetical protein
MDRASAQPQDNLSLLRSKSLKFQPLTMLRLRSKSFFTFMAMSCYTKLTQTKKIWVAWFIDWSCWYFRPSFVNFNLLSGSTLHPSPLPCMNKYMYLYSV